MKKKRLCIGIIFILAMFVSFIFCRQAFSQEELDMDRWNEKYGIFIGDSITEQNSFINVLENDYRIICQNEGISGSTVARCEASTAALFSDVVKIQGNPDFIFILAGTNDYSYAVNLGEVTDDSGNTFYGALNLLIKYVKKKWTGKPIFISTIPARDSVYDEDLGVSDTMENSKGISLDEYNDCIRIIAKKEDCYLIDTYEYSGITTKTIHSYADDGIHPNIGGVSNWERL